MQIDETPLSGVLILTPRRFADARGWFSEVWNAQTLAGQGIDIAFVQDNHSYSRDAGTVRGLHYQRPPHAEMKLVSCLRGEVWDVAVDLRAGSPTFLQWHAERLSPGNACALLIPPGFAHGFQALTEDAELLYLHSAAYAPGAEAGLNPLDPRLALPWPLPVAEMSERDRSHALLTASFEGVHL